MSLEVRILLLLYINRELEFILKIYHEDLPQQSSIWTKTSYIFCHYSKKNRKEKKEEFISTNKDNFRSARGQVVQCNIKTLKMSFEVRKLLYYTINWEFK